MARCALDRPADALLGEVRDYRPSERSSSSPARLTRDLHVPREPMRRDFSVVLEDAVANPDYTVAEHARDLMGAARSNTPGTVRRLAGRIR